MLASSRRLRFSATGRHRRSHGETKLPLSDPWRTAPEPTNRAKQSGKAKFSSGPMRRAITGLFMQAWQHAPQLSQSLALRALGAWRRRINGAAQTVGLGESAVSRHECDSVDNFVGNRLVDAPSA